MPTRVFDNKSLEKLLERIANKRCIICLNYTYTLSEMFKYVQDLALETRD